MAWRKVLRGFCGHRLNQGFACRFHFHLETKGGLPILLKSFSFSSFCREEDVGWGIRPRPAPNTFIGKSSGIGVDESLAYRSGTCR